MSAGDDDVEAAFDRCGGTPQELRSRVLECRSRAIQALNERLSRALLRRGHPAAQLCAPELRTNLAQVAAYELLQIIALGRRDALLEVSRGEVSGRVWCCNGEVVDAVCGRLKGEAALYRLIALGEGDVVVDFRAVERARQITRSMQSLVMEALRRKDECARLESRLGGTESVYCASSKSPPLTELSALERALLLAFSRGARVAAVQACSAVDDLSLLEVLASLVERGLIVRAQNASALGSIPPVEQPAAHVSHSRLRPKRWRWGWLAAAVGLGAASSALASRWLLREAPEARVSTASSALTGLSGAAPGAARAASTAAGAAGAADGAPVLQGGPPTYPLRLVADPPHAEIWLDGTPIATGEVQVALPRDGRTHELRITAPCHASETLLFRDVPPPRAVVLAPLARASSDRCMMAPLGSELFRAEPRPRVPQRS